MFQKVPSHRFHMADLVAHPWVQAPIPTIEEVQIYFK
jgi:hypothetical protein